MTGLNAQQKQAVTLDHPKILCLAGAGTGKTHSMIHRIARIVADGADPASILVLTFTNAAAFEMKDRYKRLSESGTLPEFRTFHAFCYHVLSTNYAVRTQLGYNSTPTIADEVVIRRIQQEAATMLGITTSWSKLSKSGVLPLKEAQEWALIQKSAKKLMKQRNVITFDSLCYDVCKLFVNNHESILSYKDRYQYIFVDEFQDTDPRQYEFISSFSDAQLFVVGDALQAIYSFRGADSSIIKSLAESKDWETVKLSYNYRSATKICSYANRNSEYAKSTYRIEIVTDKPGGEVDIHVGSTDNFTRQGEVNASDVSQCLSRLKELSGSTALLCRTNAEVSYLRSVLDDKGISYSAGKRNENAIHVLRALRSSEYALDWLSSLLNSDRYSDYIRLSALRHDKGGEYTLTDLVQDFRTTPRIGKMKSKLDAVRAVFNADASITDKYWALCEHLGIINLSIDFGAIKDTPELFRTVLDLLDGDNQEADSVYLGTIHSVKGLEYDNVFLFGVGGPTFRLSNEENCNLFYVGITRARNVLTVFRR